MSVDSACKRCPLCGATGFYVDTAGELLFFHVTESNEAMRRTLGRLSESRYDLSEIWCASCSWHGSRDELETAAS